jgi:predicted MFS family arabinose efflux permease
MDPETSGTRWLSVAVVMFAGITAGLHIGKVPPAIPAIAAELRLDLVTVGWLLSLLAAIAALGGSLCGGLVDRIGHRAGLIAGLLAMMLGSVIGSQAGSSTLLLSSRGVEGLGSLLVIVSAPVLIWRASAPGDLRLTLGIWGSWAPAGIAIMMAVSPFILSHFGWRASWQAAAALSLLALGAAWLVIPAVASSPHQERGGLGAVLRRPVSWMLTGNFCFYSMSFMTVFGFLPTFLVKEQHMSPTAAAMLTAIGVAGNAAGNLLGGWLTRYGLARWQMITIACVAMGAASWGIFSDSLPVAARLALCLVFAILGGLLPATVLGAAPAFAPSPAHVAGFGGMLVQGLSAGQLVGPPILAMLVQSRGSWSVAPIFMTATASVGLVLALLFRREELKLTASLHARGPSSVAGR